MESEYFGYMLALGVIVALLMSFLLYLVFKYRKELVLKDEKIKGLRNLGAQNEARQERKSKDAENKILELTHMVRRLENNINEGTKNQVVTKIEAQQNKRARELKRTGLEEG
jgi:biopolymer transport protein ExbB/TolQ